MQGVHARHDCRTVLDMRNCPAKRLLVLGNQTCIGNDQLTAKRIQVSERRSNVASTFAEAVENARQSTFRSRSTRCLEGERGRRWSSRSTSRTSAHSQE